MTAKMSSLYRSWSLFSFALFTVLSFSVAASANPKTLQLSISPRADTAAVLTPYNTYDVTIPAGELTKLRTNFVVKNLNIALGSAPVLAENLLSPFARTWLNSAAEVDGPNCFHTSLASLFNNWTQARFMDEFEHSKHLSDHARQIEWNGRTGLEFGDVLVFSTDDYGPVHAAIYIGQSDGEAIVFQKASMGRDTPYTFMKMADAISLYNRNADGPSLNSDISAYRLKKNVIDPITIGNPNGIVMDFPGM